MRALSIILTTSLALIWQTAACHGQADANTSIAVEDANTSIAVEYVAAPTTDAPVFSAEGAIIDTRKPFARDAVEMDQELRGAFGWPVFQGGVVRGLHFRIDPDGYARFAPTPRLDEDVIEVVCLRNTRVCSARKDRVLLISREDGTIDLIVTDVLPGETVGLRDAGGVERELPPTPLPVTAVVEEALARSVEIVVRRGTELRATVPIIGLTVVATYLRWVFSGQSDAALPFDWPRSPAIEPSIQPQDTPAEPPLTLGLSAQTPSTPSGEIWPWRLQPSRSMTSPTLQDGEAAMKEPSSADQPETERCASCNVPFEGAAVGADATGHQLAALERRLAQINTSLSVLANRSRLDAEGRLEEVRMAQMEAEIEALSAKVEGLSRSLATVEGAIAEIRSWNTGATERLPTSYEPITGSLPASRLPPDPPVDLWEFIAASIQFR